MLSTEDCRHCVVAVCDRDVSAATQRVSINVWKHRVVKLKELHNFKV